MEGRGYAVRTLLFPLGGSGDRCPVVSVEMDLCPVRSGNLVLYGGGNGDTDSDHRGLSYGFLDTCDALHSYQPRERKLEILKDSHIGAFAVIMLALYGLIFLGGFSEITECRTLVVAGAGSFLSRVLSGVAVVSFPSAKQEGTLYLFADKAHKRVVKTALYAQGILCIGFMMWTSFVTGGIAVAAALLTFAYYYYRSKKEFGGITGDTAGYFVTFCEGCVVVAAAIAEHMMLTV